MKRLLRMCVWLTVLFPLGTNAWSAGYTFTKIADTTTVGPNGTFSNFDSPAISGNTVAFVGGYPGGHGIFTSSGGAFTTIVKRGDPGPAGPYAIVSDPAISGDTVAFFGAFGDVLQTVGIFMGSGGPITTIALRGDPAATNTFSPFGPPAISGNTVAFRGGYASSSGPASGIFTGSGGALTTIIQSGNPAPSGAFFNFGEPSISGDTVAFDAAYDSRGIFTVTGGTVTKIVELDDPAPVGTFSFVSSPSISGDNIAFSGGDQGGDIVFRSKIDGTSIVPTANVSDVPPGYLFMVRTPPKISGDEVAFLGSYSNEDGTLRGESLFVGDGGPLETVIATGDALFGSPVTSLFVGFPGPGNELGSIGFDPDGSGKLAFRYELADGRVGIALASIVPEACTFAMISVAILVGLTFARIR